MERLVLVEARKYNQVPQSLGAEDSSVPRRQLVLGATVKREETAPAACWLAVPIHAPLGCHELLADLGHFRQHAPRYTEVSGEKEKQG